MKPRSDHKNAEVGLEDSWVVLKRLEPLVLIEAVKKATDDASRN